MKIEYLTGDLFSFPDKYIAHGCNCQGVMGKGFAYEIRRRFPEVYQQYSKFCNNIIDRKELLGGIQIIKGKERVIINCFTQFDYLGSVTNKNKNKRLFIDYKAIKSCMDNINRYCNENHIDTILMPKIGVGLGGGNWDKISSIIEKSSKSFQPIVCEL